MDGQRLPCPIDCDRRSCAWWIATDTQVREDIEDEPTAERHIYVYDCAIPLIAHSALELVRLCSEIAGRLQALLEQRQ